MRKRFPVIVLHFIVFIVGCSVPQQTSTPSPSDTLIPYAPASPTPTTVQVIPTFTVIPSPGPSPTPFVHVVKKDDTLLGIALLYGVSLEELMAANPEINPRILSIDQAILIPSVEGDAPGGLIPTATPIPLQFSSVHCYPASADYTWCLTSVLNDSEGWLEGISAIITIFNSAGEQIGAQPAYAPLNLLPPGRAMPLGALFLQPVDLAIATTNTSFFTESVEGRYLTIELEWIIDDNLTSETVWHGTISLENPPGNEREAERVNILITAFDDGDNVVGYRKLDGPETIGVGDTVELEFELFSLGPTIARLEVLAEAVAFAGEE